MALGLRDLNLKLSRISLGENGNIWLVNLPVFYS